MSVDSFIQTRISVDTASEHSSGVGVHHGAQGVHGHHGGSGSLRSAEPAIDPRWGMSVPGAPAEQHAFFESIANELADTDRQAINFTPTPSTGERGGRMTSDSEDQSHSTGSRRTSMLTRRLKHGKTSSSMNRSLASTPIGSNYAHGSSMGSGSPSTTAVDSRSSLSTSSAATVNSTKRPAVPSSGYPTIPTSPPPVSSPSTPNTAPITTSTTTSGSGGTISNASTTNRRGNTPGPIHVSRQRTLSLGGTAASSSAANIPTTAGPLRLATDENQSTPTTKSMNPNMDDTSEYCIAFVGAKGCGKSTLIRKVIKSYPTVGTSSFQAGEFTVNSTTVQVTVTSALRPIRILEVDSSAVAYPGNLWPQELPRADGILLCYDASNEDSYTRIPELVAGYHALGQAVVILACKSDLHKVISPSRADACGKPYEIGLVEVSAVTDIGKKKLRACFNWEIKAIGRHRRSGNTLNGPYRNPASPGVLQTSQAPWDPKAIATATPPLTQSSSSSSIVPRHPNNSAPALPSLDTYSLPNTSAAPSTARTSIDSNLGNSTTPMTPSRRRSPSLPSSPAQTRTVPDTYSSLDARGIQTVTSATPSPIPGPAAGSIEPSAASTSAAPPARNASSSSIQYGQQNTTSNVAPATTPVTATAQTTSIGGGGPVPDGSRNQRESSSLQWATLDEILDKLLFVSVSGDDPVFIQHFFLTYRRFATPRSVLLGMQKRMRQLGQETRDPLLAKFAQMRICNLLSQWKENYPTDFGAPGTFGALSALLKQIVSNVHLVHYASDLLPFLEEVPKLVDRESTWAKKDEVGDDTDSESIAGTDEEEILPDLHDDEDTYVGKGKAFEKRTPVSSNPAPPPSSATDNRPYPPKASSSAPNVATITNPSPPIPTPSIPKPSLPSAGLSNDLHESVITMDRPLTRTSRVNIKDLRNTATYIIQTEPVHTAQEITRRMLILFKRIEARDWLRRTLSTKGYDKEHDAIGQLGRLFNYLCCWVSAMIVAFDRPQARARVVDKMILIAKALRQLNNYMGMKAFVAGINSVRGNDDEELTQIIAAKPNSNWKQFQSLHVLLGSARMGQAYRLALKHTIGPAIPDLERHGSDLLRTNEANLDYNPQDPNLIHWGKFTIMGKLVGTVTLYQNRCHTMPDYRDLEERPHIGNLVFGQVVWDYDTLMNREARALEEAQTTESSSGLRRLIPSFKV